MLSHNKKPLVNMLRNSQVMAAKFGRCTKCIKTSKYLVQKSLVIGRGGGGEEGWLMSFFKVQLMGGKLK